LIKNHQKTWDNYHKFSHQRGTLVAEIINRYIEIKKKNMLDIGCGDGSTSVKFAQLGAHVTAIDIRPDQIEKLKNNKINFHHGSFENFKEANKKFDTVILQDVLEHVPNPEITIKKVKSLLSHNGIIYISTPNRLSLLNTISDPHWHLPFVSMFSKRCVKFLVCDVFRKDRRYREDWPALLSLIKLKKLMIGNQIEILFVNSIVAQYLFENPESVVCKLSHLKLINWIKRNNLQSLILKIVNDKFGIFNYFINPTWYIIGKLK
jgi:SAM-dependent methyltransferase